MQLMFDRDLTPRQLWTRRILIGGAVAVLIGGFVAYRPALQHYQAWKQDRALAQAKDYMTRADFVRAKLALDVALAAVPGDQDTLRTAADLLDSVGAAEVLPLRRHLVALNPGSVTERVALIKSALRFNDTNTVADALREMPSEHADNPEALRAALAYAEATGNKPIADAIYTRLRALEPHNENLTVMHAVLRLASPRAETVAAARQELRALAEEPRHALFIHRELLLAALRHEDLTDAQRLAAALAALPSATLADRLHGANLALNHQHRAFAEVQAELLPHLQDNAADAAEWVRWLLLVGESDQAVAWLDAHPHWKQNPELAASRAELAATQTDWKQLASLLEAGAWGPIKTDTVQLAFAAHVASRRENPTLRETLWLETIASTGSTLSELTVIYRLAAIWGWDQPAEKVLWAIARSHPQQSWASQTLFNAYHQRRDSAELLALFALLRDAPGASDRQRHDWALLTLLVEGRLTWTPEKQELKTLHLKDPTNPNYALSYALALAVNQQSDEALTVLKTLSRSDLADPDRAPYLAFIYGAAGDRTSVEDQTTLRPRLSHLLPEELNLFDKARIILNERRGRPAAPSTNG